MDELSAFLGSFLMGGALTLALIPPVASYFVKNTALNGIDMAKKGKPKIPESLGIVVGCCYLLTFILCFLIRPYYFYGHFSDKYSNLAALTSIFAMLMLGFIDDCKDLKWRYKLMLPFAASIPLLSVYYYNYHDNTTIIVPLFLRSQLNFNAHLDLGLFYYIYMLMYVVFCTNAINIYAGINGLESGQSVVIAMSVIIYNILELTIQVDELHLFSIKLLLPFTSCSLALLYYNWYPAKVFVGDSFCYFAGMTLAVVGILGHFSEEILLFALPQILNFLLSLPQICKIVPCPRHRLPRFDQQSGLLNPSTFEFKWADLNPLGRIIITVFSNLKVIKLEKLTARGLNYRCSNFTLINVWLCWFGPKHEKILTKHLLYLQIFMSMSIILLKYNL